MDHANLGVPEFDKSMARVVRERAVQLKNASVGYVDAVERIVAELIEASEGKSNGLTAVGLVADMKWFDFDTPLMGSASGATIGASIGLVGGPVGALVGAGIGATLGALAGHERQTGRIEERRTMLREKLLSRVQPIVSEVYG